MFRFVLAVTAAVIAVSAQAAADWELASIASNGMRTYIDISTITAEDDSRNTWEKQTYVKPERDGTSYTVNRTVRLLKSYLHNPQLYQISSNRGDRRFVSDSKL
jgi:opacity protein-like surface antigen